MPVAGASELVLGTAATRRELFLAAEAANLAYRDGTHRGPDGENLLPDFAAGEITLFTPFGSELWRVVTPYMLGLAFDSGQPWYEYDTGGLAGVAGALVLQSVADPSQYVLAFRGTDPAFDGYGDVLNYLEVSDGAYLEYFRPLLEALAAHMPDDASLVVTGHSLGAWTAGTLEHFAASFGAPFQNAVYATFATPDVGASSALLDFGFRNDPIFHGLALVSPQADVSDHFYWIDESAASGPYQWDFDFHAKELYSHAALRLAKSSHVSGFTRQDVIFFVDASVAAPFATYADEALSARYAVTGRSLFLGGATANELTGGARIDTIEGGGGNDILRGAGGADILVGGIGDDTLVGGADGDNFVFFGAFGHDRILDFNPGEDRLSIEQEELSRTSGVDADNDGLADDSVIVTAFGSISLIDVLLTPDRLGTEANDLLAGGAGLDRIFAFGGNDRLSGGAQSDWIDGGAGDDLMEGGTGNDTLLGGDGNDTIYAGQSTATLYGSSAPVIYYDRIYGGTGDDTIRPNGGSAFIDGGSGVDTLSFALHSNSARPRGVTVNLTTGTGSSGNNPSEQMMLEIVNIEIVGGTDYADVLIGDANDNQLRGGAGADTIHGMDGNDIIWGGKGYFYGGAGDDVLDFGLINDGGDGVDTLEFRGGVWSGGRAISVNLAEGWADLGDAATGATVRVQILSIENIRTGWNVDDVLVGSIVDNRLEGGGGNDRLEGLGGNDTLVGGAGNDLLIGGDGDDLIIDDSGAIAIDGGAGDDVVRLSALGSLVSGTLLVGAIDGGEGLDTLTSQMWGDDLSGVSLISIEVLDATSQNVRASAAQFHAFEQIRNSSGVAAVLSLTASGEMDIADALGALRVTVNGSGGDDRVTVGSGNDTVFGDAGNDVLNGREGNDTLTGGAGDDALIGGGGNNTLNGGDGVDTVSYADLATGVLAQLAVGTFGQATHGSNSDALAGIENLTGSAHDDTLGSSSADNVLSGGLGRDTASYSAASGGVTINLATAGRQNTGGAGFDTLVSIENLLGSSFDDTLTGNMEANTLSGGAGDDVLAGAGGNDRLEDLAGQAGVAALNGGAGDDEILLSGAFFSGVVNGSIGFDQVTAGGDFNALQFLGIEVLNTGSGIIRATAAQLRSFATIRESATNVAGTVRLELTTGGVLNLANKLGSAAVEIVGSATLDVITGATGDDVMRGGGGGDTLNGVDGNDQLDGGDGPDTLNGGNGDDVIDGGSGNDTILGGAGNDRITDLFGTAASISAGSGNDNISLGSLLQTGTVNGGLDVDEVNASLNLRSLQFIGVEVLNCGSGVLQATASQLEAFDTIRVSAADATGAVSLRLSEAGLINLAGELGTRAVTFTGSSGIDDITTGDGADIIAGGSGDDLLRGRAGNDVFLQSLSDGRDIIDGGAGVDTYRLTATPSAETFRIYTRAAALAAGMTGLAGSTEIVITWEGTANINIVAELDNIEEIQIDALVTTANNGNGSLDIGAPSGDTIIVIGDFTSTSLDYSTIRITGSSGDDTIDITGLTSAHRVVFTSNGGDDAVVGTPRPQDVFEGVDQQTRTMLGGALGGDLAFAPDGLEALIGLRHGMRDVPVANAVHDARPLVPQLEAFGPEATLDLLFAAEPEAHRTMLQLNSFADLAIAGDRLIPAALAPDPSALRDITPAHERWFMLAEVASIVG